MEPTNEQIRQRGLEALHKELGGVGMIRFLQQFDKGQGDYAKERRGWVDRMTMEDICAGLNIEKPPQKPKRKKSSRRRRSSA